MSDEAFELDLDRLLALLPRYATEGPRYTSYPTAPVWQDDYGPEDLKSDLGHEDVEAGDGLSLYVHVPFCESLCHFCACNKMITKDHGCAAPRGPPRARRPPRAPACRGRARRARGPW